MTERDAFYRAILRYPEDDTPRLIFADWLDENGEGDRAAFIRVQVELWRIQSGAVSDGDNRQLKSGPYGERFFVEPVKTVEPLLIRERDLFTAHGAKWFGANVTLDPPEEWAYRTPHDVALLIARGFPAHWYGPWDKWVADACMRTDDLKDCPDCKSTGRIPGACDTIAWRPEWTMECGRCDGQRLVSKRRPSPQRPGGQMNMVEGCPTCHGSGRVPRPCPPGAVPLMNITITGGYTDDDLIANGASVLHGNPSKWEFKTWPGLTFHLPPQTARDHRRIDDLRLQIAIERANR